MELPLRVVPESLARVLPRPLADSDRPSVTAEWVALVRAAERNRPAPERIVNDPYASTFLALPMQALLAALTPGEPLITLAGRLAPTDPVATLLTRHRYIDEALLRSLPSIAQVLVLGAGYDARAYRFAHSLGARPVFEVDLAPTSRRKARIVAARPHEFASNTVTRVELDVRAGSIASQLRGAPGFVAHAPTFVAWEGVAMYLPAATVTSTLTALADVCGSGSVLAMDCLRPAPSGITGRVREIGEQLIRVVGEPVRFHVTPQRMSALLAQSGWDTEDVAGAAELTERFATAGRRCDDLLFLLTAQRR